jgi:hypothetical protein
MPPNIKRLLMEWSLEDANKRLVEMAQAGQIAGSKTLAEYLIAAKNPQPASVDHRDQPTP